MKAKIDTRIPPIELAPNRFLKPQHEFVSSKNYDEKTIDAIIENFRANGAEVVAVSEAFGVDKNENENKIANLARRKGLLATSGHEVSTLYGLRTRTRTAVLNGAILPKMIHTATMTDECVKRAGIRAPLMIMRSDGGVMSVEEVHRRPIMTMLSGPAAGIAGALMYEKVSDGIFIEVGGTSGGYFRHPRRFAADESGARRRSSHVFEYSGRANSGDCGRFDDSGKKRRDR